MVSISFWPEPQRPAALQLRNAPRSNQELVRQQGSPTHNVRMRTLASLADDLTSARASSRALVEECLSNIRAPDGEGARVFLKVRDQQALAFADEIDRERAAGKARSRYAGIPISVKDLFDLAGDVTTAGSTILRKAPVATRDAPTIARLIAAGFVPIGRTNMTEFAFSGLGLNIHYGTPLNPHDRATRRIPGGSSSGAAVSVTDGMAFAGLGTDTGGSCRIPAAFCGITGYKPTARRVPLEGAFPLSPSLDSIGPLAHTVDCCAILDSILANEPLTSAKAATASALRFAAPQTYVLENMEAHVAQTFARSLTRLSRAGATIVDIELPELLELPELNRKGGLAPPEAYAIHRDWTAQHATEYDVRVLTRILRGREQDAADYIQLLRARARFIERVRARTSGFDALILPTVPIVAPPIDSLVDDATYARVNALALRNPSIINFLDGCAISLPCHVPGELPVGLMLAAHAGHDSALFAIARIVETVFRSQ